MTDLLKDSACPMILSALLCQIYINESQKILPDINQSSGAGIVPLYDVCITTKLLTVEIPLQQTGYSSEAEVPLLYWQQSRLFIFKNKTF